MDFKFTAVVVFTCCLLSACFEVSGHKASADFDSCLANGGDILESYPRSCVIDNQAFKEIIPETSQLETRKMVFTIGPKTVPCEGFHPVEQQCLIVNGEYFYDSIAGFKHRRGITATVEVERRQICDPSTLNSCPQDASIYRYRLLKMLTQEGAAELNVDEKTNGFIGEVVNIKVEKDGFSVTLQALHSQDTVIAVISPANLGPNSDFDFADVALGNLLKVTGEQFSLGQQSHMAARSALSYQRVAIANRAATSQERSACLLAGGEIGKVGRLQTDQCVQVYPDAGSSCSDSKACFGQCLISTDDANTLARGAQVTGACSASNNSFGCKALVEGGRYNGVLCID